MNNFTWEELHGYDHFNSPEPLAEVVKFKPTTTITNRPVIAHDRIDQELLEEWAKNLEKQGLIKF